MRATPIEEAGIAFAQMRANQKLLLDEDGKRWAEDVARALDEAENANNALVDALNEIVSYSDTMLAGSPTAQAIIRELAETALRAAGRLP